MKNEIFVTRPFFPPKEDFDKLSNSIWENKWLTNKGPLFTEFQQQLADYLQVSQKNISLTVNGHIALDLALKALHITGEVITTPFTFASTTHAIVLNGLKPVFCDIEDEFFNIDATKIEQLITPQTTAIVPVHVYGHPCDVRKIDELAQKYHLKVIYDAAHAFGVCVGGKSIVEYGDAAMVSFHATKLFHTIEGGMLYSADGDIICQADLLKNFGIQNELDVPSVGINGKMNEFQAAMGILNLRYIDGLIEQRKQITRLYAQLLQNVRGIVMNVPQEMSGFRYNYSYIPVLITDEFPVSRDELYEHLKASKVYARKYFYPLTSDYACYQGQFNSDNTPTAQRVSKQVLSLPIYNGLEESEIVEICDLIKYF